jgi:mRNA-degrading endonuclease RelE of RelBE toxin-antitoxin system
VREEVLLSGARRALERAPETDRTRFEEIIRRLCDDPGVAEPVKTLLDMLPVEVFRYNDGEYWVLYDLPDVATVRVWMVWRA